MKQIALGSITWVELFFPRCNRSDSLISWRGRLLSIPSGNAMGKTNGWVTDITHTGSSHTKTHLTPAFFFLNTLVITDCVCVFYISWKLCWGKVKMLRETTSTADNFSVIALRKAINLNRGRVPLNINLDCPQKKRPLYLNNQVAPTDPPNFKLSPMQLNQHNKCNTE